MLSSSAHPPPSPFLVSVQALDDVVGASPPWPQTVRSRAAPEYTWLCASHLFLHLRAASAALVSSSSAKLGTRFARDREQWLDFALCAETETSRTVILHAIWFWGVLDLTSLSVLVRLFESPMAWTDADRAALRAARARVSPQPVLDALWTWLHHMPQNALGACARHGLVHAVRHLCSPAGRLALPHCPLAVAAALRCAARAPHAWCLPDVHAAAVAEAVPDAVPGWWAADVTAAAAQSGNLGALRFALDRECPWDARAGDWAVEWHWDQIHTISWVDDLTCHAGESIKTC